MRKILLILTFLFSLTVNAQKIIFTPQWLPQSQFAGYYVALEKGFYEEVGLDVEIEHVTASDYAINRLNEGKCDAITMTLFDAIINIDQGMDVVNVLQTALHTGLVIVPRNVEMKTIHDLRNKRVGIWRTHYNYLSEIINKDYNLNIEWIPFVQSASLYISGAVDATMAMIYNEAYRIYSSGFEDIDFISMADYGYDFPEEGVYFTREFYEKYPDKAKAFAQASRRGWEWAHANPRETVSIVMKVIENENMPASRQHQEWMLKEVLKLQLDKETGNPTFELDEDKIELINEFLLVDKRINKAVKKSQIIGE